jgi:hypothetical protein
MRRFAAISLFALFFLTACGSQLVIDSSPPNARVRVNNQDYGPAPVSLKDLPSGNYSVEVTKDRFETWQTNLYLRASQSLHAILTPTPPPQVVERAVIPPRPPLSLSVFTEPDGASVWVDGKRMGTAGPDRAVTVCFENDPTRSEVVVEKPGYERWSREILLETNRDNRVYVKLTPLSAWYDYTTDGELMRQAVAKVVTSTAALPTLRRGARIAVLSITHAEGTDEPLQAVLEDAFVSTLAQAGFTPAERDDQMLVQLAHSTVGDSLPYTVLTRHEGPDTPFVYDAELATRRREVTTEERPLVTTTTSTSRTGDDCCPEEHTTVTRREETVTRERARTVTRLEGHIPTADQFLAYRILECGISKTPVGEGEPRPEPTLHRLADVRVHLRIIDAKTGVITWAGFLTGEIGDEIPARVSANLANPPNRFAPEPLPDTWDRLRHGTTRHTQETPLNLEPRVR